MLIEKLSASSISMWLQCPYKFRLFILRQLPQVSQTYQEYGILLHGVLDQYVKLHTLGTPYLPVDSILQFYANDYPEYSTGKPYATGEKLLLKYYKEHFQGNICKMVEAEKKFGIPLGKFKITGRIDRTDKLSEDVYEVIDYKSGKVEDKILKQDIQLLMYAYKTFNDNDFKLKECKVSLHYLQFGVFSDIIVKEDLPPFREKLESIYNEITNTVDFKPKKNQYCFNCEAKGTCPLFNHTSKGCVGYNSKKVKKEVIF